MFRYRLHSPDGDDLGEATYAVMATWVALRDDEGDPAPDGPEPTFGTGEPPVTEGTWASPGY